MTTPEGIRILHVDDESEIAELTAEMLNREDERFTVETAPSASEGLNHLANHEVDCIVSDYDMPGMNGIEFLERVRDTYPDLPFILYTGKGSEEVASDAISVGVTDYLQKGSGAEQYELLANRARNAVKQVRARSQADKHRRISTVVREIDQALVRATSRAEIDQCICQILTDADPYVFAWIGTVDSQTHRVEPKAVAGHDDGYLDEITITTDDSPTGRSPGGTALREGRVVIAQNIRDDDTFHPWRDQALDRGYGSIAAIPLTHKETQYGLLAVYADRTDAFDEAERDLLSELGDTIAHAYHRVTIQHEYQNQYRELFEEAPVMFTFTQEVDGEPIIEDCNRLFADRLGYSREELRGTRLAEVYTEQSAEALLAGGGYDRALTGEFIREKREFVTSDGDIVETLLRATPRRNTDGEVIGTHALFIDITDQTRLQTLEDLRERMEFALEATDSILFELDLESGEETRHGPFERLYGVASDELETAEDFFEHCVHPDDRDMLRALEQREAIADRDGSLKYDFRIHPDCGDQRWIQFEAYAVTDQDGTPQRLIGLDTDITKRKEREQKLEQTQHRFRTLYEQLSQPVVEVEYDERDPIVVDVNPAFREVFGYDSNQIIGESLDAYIVPEDRQTEAREINEYVIEGGQLTSKEVTRQTADGTRDFLLENALYDDATGGFAIYTDITDRKEQEHQLERKNARLSVLFEQFPEPTLAYAYEDGEPYIRQVNEAFTETFGYDAEEAVGEHVDNLVVPPDRQAEAEQVDQRVKAGDAIDEILRRQTRDGIRQFRFRNIPVSDNDTIDGYGIYADVTERKLRERELQRKERIIQEMDDGVVVVQDQTITYTNPQISEVIGYPAEELVGEPMSKYIAPEDRETVRRRYKQRLAGNEPPKTYEISLLTRDGGTVPVEITAARVTYGGEAATVSIVRDITDRKERVRELERQNERLEEFASIVSHDLRNPLSVASSRLELAQETCDSPHLADIADAHDRMEGLIDDLLTLAQQGEQVHEMHSLSLSGLTEECWDVVATTGATLKIDADVMIRADRNRLKQVIENLIRNAVEHGSSEVTVRIGELAGDSGFYVADDGPGIPEDSHEEIFESGYSTAQDGTGFGLAIVREIVEAHDWDITVTDSNGGGARFEITGVEIAE